MTIASENQFLHKIINFCIGPQTVPCRLQTLGPLGDLSRTSYDNHDCNVYHRKIVANHGFLITLK